jgi:hypothetical protein
LPGVLRRAGIVFVTLVALVCGGCMGGDDEASLSTNDLEELVLQPEDLPPSFTRFDFGELTLSDVHLGPRGDQSRFGRLGGWKARYRYAGAAQTTGPLVVESRVDLFQRGDGAAQDLAAYESELEQTAERFSGEGRLLEPPGLGDGSAAITLKQGTGRFATRFFTVAWRRAELTASISVNGFEGKIALEDALDLARKQDNRLALALEG